jgi:hypothetical protein
MVVEVSNNAPVAPSRQEPTKAAPVRETERGAEPTSSRRDRVSISREARELLVEESRAEETRERDRIDALRTDEANRRAELRRVETDRLEERAEPEPAESEDNERTRA